MGKRIYPTDTGEIVLSRPGEYGKTKLMWYAIAPDGSGVTINPQSHTVIEHDDGTITVSPSITTKRWHGWLKKGVWRSD